jgi:hypothetical protein
MKEERTMPKGTNSITPVLNQKSTSPRTRVIDPARAGETGSVMAAPVSVPSLSAAHERRQKPDNNRVAVDLQTVGATTNEQLEAEQQHPVGPEVAVETKH